MARFRGRAVTARSGVEWRIGRRWISRGMPRWRKVPVGGEGTREVAWWSMSPPDLGNVDLGGLDALAAAIAIFVGAIVVAVVLIPLLLFGIELIIAGLVIAAGILGRGLLGRPWVVHATPVGSADKAESWRVSGWRRSGRLIDEVATSLEHGLEPAPAEGEAIGSASSAAPAAD